jgi:hypothetical protein
MLPQPTCTMAGGKRYCPREKRGSSTLVCRSEMLVDTWDGWLLERFLYFFIALAYVMIWVQVILFHWRGVFRSRYMWGPVLYTPALIGMAIILGVIRGGAVETAFVVVFGIGVSEGLIGYAMPDRFTLSESQALMISRLLAKS